jgi:hypothetical protein
MDSRFNLDDLVIFEGQIYKVRSIHFMNPQIPNDPYVCGLTLLKDDNNYMASQLMVREGLLQKCNQKGLKVLYGKDKGNGSGL